MWSYYDNNQRHFICSRVDLGQEPHRSILADAAANGRILRCGCRNDICLRLFPYIIPGRGPCVRRYSIDDAHADGCPFSGKLEPIYEPLHAPGTEIYTMNMLLEQDGPTERMPVGGSVTKTGSGLRYPDFVHFFQKYFTQASLESFEGINYGTTFRDAGIVNPNRLSLLDRVKELMCEPLLQGEISVERCLRENGLKLFWGLTRQPLVEESETPFCQDGWLEFELGPHWDCDGYHRERHPLLKIYPDVLSDSRGNAKAHSHIIPPPYFYAALTAPDDNAYRAYNFYRVPAALAGNHISLVESETERRCAKALTAEGVAFLKPHVDGDMRILRSGLWPFRTDERGRLPNRPDFIAFADGKVWILYVFNTEDPAYHKRVDASVAEMEKYISSPEVVVRKIHGRYVELGLWR
jgi:hypothetical protein